MAKIQVEIGGQLHDVTKTQLFDLARVGTIRPDTKIVIDGKETKARKVQGMEFADLRADEDSIVEEPEPVKPVQPPVPFVFGTPPSADPVPMTTPSVAPTTVSSAKYVYKCVAAPMILNVKSTNAQSQSFDEQRAVASYAEIINNECHDGWEFYSMEQITVNNLPGCLGALLGVKAEATVYNMLVFRRHR